MLLMIEKRNKVATCHTIYRYAQTMMNIRNYHILAIRTSIIYMDEECLRGFLLMVLSGLKNHFNLMNISQKAIMMIAMKDIFLKLMFNNLIT